MTSKLLIGMQLNFIANMTYDNDIFVGIEISNPTEKNIIDY